VRQRIAHFLGVQPEQVTFFWKGRVALYAILKAIGIKPGDEIILPAFTCVVVVNPLLYLGAKPVYVDIDPKTYTLDPAKIEEKITHRTRVILAQNTYGLAPDLDALFNIAQKHNLFVIEDCAHGLGGHYKGRLNGTIADASFFSTQWNKPFSTGVGGFAIAQNPEIAEKLIFFEKSCRKPSFRDQLQLKMLIAVRKRLRSNFYWQAIKTYRWLSKNNLILGSSQGSELTSTEMPAGFAQGFSIVQKKVGLQELQQIEKYIGHRKNIAKIYDSMLKDVGIEPPWVPSEIEHTYLKYPILVRNREQFFKKAELGKIELGDWFLSPIHPITDNFSLFDYHLGENPIGEKIAEHVVNLPTHPGLHGKEIEKVASFISKNQTEIFRSFTEINQQ